MNKYRVIITMSAVCADEYNHETYIEAASEEEVFKIVTSKDWFQYTVKGKVDGKEYTRHYFVQMKNVTDIYIRKEG